MTYSVETGTKRQRPITPKQKQVLDLVRDGINANGYAPTLDEMAKALGKAKGSVYEIVSSLVNRGHLLREPNVARNLRLAEPEMSSEVDELVKAAEAICGACRMYGEDETRVPFALVKTLAVAVQAVKGD